MDYKVETRLKYILVAWNISILNFENSSLSLLKRIFFFKKKVVGPEFFDGKSLGYCSIILFFVWRFKLIQDPIYCVPAFSAIFYQGQIIRINPCERKFRVNTMLLFGWYGKQEANTKH